MKYNKQKLEFILNKLAGKYVEDICYYDDYENYESFNGISDDVLNVPLLGMSIHCSSGLVINLIATDYAPYLGLGGIKADEGVIIEDPRPSHIAEQKWVFSYRNKITTYRILESTYLVNKKTITLPTGIIFSFENSEYLSIYNVGIENYDDDKTGLSLQRGEKSLQFFSTRTL